MLKKKIHIQFIGLALAAAFMVIIAPAYAVDFTISGQVNRAALYADDGTSAKWFFVDNDNSSTRFRFRGSNDFENDWKVGFLWEVEMQSNASNKVAMTDDSDLGDVTFNERHMEVWIEKWGRLRLGQGDTASNGTSEVDLSGTAVAAYSSVGDVGGNFEFRDGSDKTGITVGASRNNFDGISRRDRVRYDTPRWAGFFASGSIEGNSEWDLAARYAGDFGWARLAAAAGYADYGTSSDSKDGTRDGNFSSSASMLFDFGLNLTASYAFRDQDGTNPWNLFGKIGYQFLKKHAASIQYSRTKNLLNKDNKGDTFGVGYVFTPWKSVELYGTYYLHMLDLDQGSDPDDINIFMTGARVRF
jgi:predicted porin